MTSTIGWCGLHIIINIFKVLTISIFLQQTCWRQCYDYGLIVDLNGLYSDGGKKEEGLSEYIFFVLSTSDESKQIIKTPIWPKNYAFFHWFFMTSLRIIWMHFFPVEVHFPTWLVPKVWGLARMANQVIISQQMYVHCTFFIHIRCVLCRLWKNLVSN